jgi:hypothetical protein
MAKKAKRQARDLGWMPDTEPMTIVVPADLMRQISVEELFALCVLKNRMLPSLKARIESRRTGKPVLVK